MQKNVHYILRFKDLNGLDLDPNDERAQAADGANLYIFHRGCPIPLLPQAKACVGYNPGNWLVTHKILSMADNELNCHTVGDGWHITYANLDGQNVEYIISSIRECVA
jgi:hypothetical protein